MLHRNKPMEFADMHCHILPGVDDGAGNRQEAMKMLEIASRAGVTHMIVTPHYKEGHHNASPATINKLVLSLQNEAAEAGIPISLFPGNEIFYFQEIADRLERNEICTLNDTEYVLIEFMPSDSFTRIRNAVNHLVGMGYIPIVAHAERYDCMLKHKDAVGELRSLGGEIQINIASIEGRMGYAVKHFAHRLLTRKQIDYLGTDAHDSRKRTPDVKACMSRLYRKYDRDYIERISYWNAMQIMGDTDR